MRTVVYRGNFDPMTKDHPEVVQRAARLFDRVIGAVANNESKAPIFSVQERVSLVQECILDPQNAATNGFADLLDNYVGNLGAQAVIRGLRAVLHDEFRFQLALMNRKLNGHVAKLFMMPKATYTFVSSRLVKESARLGGDVAQFVPSTVVAAVHKKIRTIQ
jgi:pantetheine-phosphate adenylyltransferase